LWRGVSGGLFGGIADVAIYPRALPVAGLRHYRLLIPA
jgi:hypothetical protein